jgi:hypothetical protein
MENNLIKRPPIKWIISILLVVVLLSPMIFIETVYQISLSEIQKPLPSPCSVQYPKPIQEAFWYGYNESGEMKVVPVMSWTLFYAITRALMMQNPAMRTTMNPQGSRVATEVAREYLQGYPPGSMLKWHLMSLALSIWFTRHWTAEELLNEVAEKCYYGRHAYGMNQASETYFKKKPEALNDKQLATLVALTYSPDRYLKDPNRLKTRVDKILGLMISHGESGE